MRDMLLCLPHARLSIKLSRPIMRAMLCAKHTSGQKLLARSVLRVAEVCFVFLQAHMYALYCNVLSIVLPA